MTPRRWSRSTTSAKGPTSAPPPTQRPDTLSGAPTGARARLPRDDRTPRRPRLTGQCSRAHCPCTRRPKLGRYGGDAPSARPTLRSDDMEEQIFQVCAVRHSTPCERPASMSRATRRPVAPTRWRRVIRPCCRLVSHRPPVSHRSSHQVTNAVGGHSGDGGKQALIVGTEQIVPRFSSKKVRLRALASSKRRCGHRWRRVGGAITGSRFSVRLATQTKKKLKKKAAEQGAAAHRWV